MTRIASFIFLALLALDLGAETNSVPLTLNQAEAQALKAHPRITIAQLRQLIAKESVVEARAPFWPFVTGNGTLVGTDGDNNRVAAGGLNNPIIYDRGAFGLNVTWQIFDFGRTENLLQVAKLRARSEQQNLAATRAQILFLVDVAYYTALQARAVLQVAEQTVSTRKLLRDQVGALATNRLKSELDVSFAESALAEARVLTSRALNEEQSAQARLASLLGDLSGQPLTLADEFSIPALPSDPASLIVASLAARPELLRLRLDEQASTKFAHAERALHLPVISAIGVGGVIPEHNPRLPDNYLAAGVNVSVPIFSGFQTEARRKAAELKAQVASEAVREEEQNVIREVRISFLNAQNAQQRIGLAEQLLRSSSRAFDLAEAKYKAGASSLAELAQAQLVKTTAEIAQVSARYEFLIQNAALDFQTGARLKPNEEGIIRMH